MDDVAEALGFLALNKADWIVADAASVDDFARLFDGTQLPIVLVEGAEPVSDDARSKAHIVLAKPMTKSALLNIFACDDARTAVAA